MEMLEQAPMKLAPSVSHTCGVSKSRNVKRCPDKSADGMEKNTCPKAWMKQTLYHGMGLVVPNSRINTSAAPLETAEDRA